MNTTTALTLGALALAGALASGSPARAEQRMSMLACAPGYHADARGDCQSDIPMVDSYCQPGFHFHVFTGGNGYRCEPNTATY